MIYYEVWNLKDKHLQSDKVIPFYTDRDRDALKYFLKLNDPTLEVYTRYYTYINGMWFGNSSFERKFIHPIHKYDDLVEKDYVLMIDNTCLRCGKTKKDPNDLEPCLKNKVDGVTNLCCGHGSQQPYLTINKEYFRDNNLDYPDKLALGYTEVDSGYDFQDVEHIFRFFSTEDFLKYVDYLEDESLKI